MILQLSAMSKNLTLVALAVASSTTFCWRATGQELTTAPERTDDTPTDFGQKANLPAPSGMSVNDFERHLFEFVNNRRYVKLGWLRDKRVRDTGPFIDGREYGTHPAVRVFYSPEIVQWLVDGRQGKIPDGAVIIKEQFEAPAIRHDGLDDAALFARLRSWTIMVKDSKGSHDGWFWSNPGKDQKIVDYYSYPFEEPYSGFGLYCLRCHGSTTSPGIEKEYTFASLRNIDGFPGEPLLFRVDQSWRIEHEDASQLLANVAEPVADALGPQPEQDKAQLLSQSSHPRCAASDHPTVCQPSFNPEFAKFFPQIQPPARVDVQHIPPVTYDSVHRSPKAVGSSEQAFLTSDQCQSCHAGLLEPFGPTMFVPTGETRSYGADGLHVSPFGEWRWTPMGLAGRDPVFFAQVESELAYLKKRYPAEEAHAIGSQLQDTCLGCHGVMGKRQHVLDRDATAAKTNSQSARELFAITDVLKTELDPSSKQYAESQHAGLARDGVSCMVCHRMQPKPQPPGDDRPYLEHFLETSITGNFLLGETDTIYGPFKDDQVSPYIMEHSTAFKPKHSDFIKSSQMCGTCHTVNLPIVDWKTEAGEEPNDLMLAEPNPAFQEFHHHVEQATYLEWLNSDFENELNPGNPNGQSCQDCHMSRGIHDSETDTHLDVIRTKIAVVQDSSYQDAENLAPHESLNVRVREKDFARHNFRGLNMFMVEMFNQFDDILGVRKHDYMTGSKGDIEFAKRDFLRQASSETAEIKVHAQWQDATSMTATVLVKNKVGHRFPSGVGFRRAFIELVVVEKPTQSSDSGDESIVWASGRTNSIGVILDGNGQPLATEFFDDASNPEKLYQPHHEVIRSQNQVQIYETLMMTRGDECTTSFIHGCTIRKDNRLLPRGWTSAGPGGGLKGHFLTATYPGPDAAQDTAYQDGSGTDSTRYEITLPRPITTEQRGNLVVRATLFYQAMPPYFLQNIFNLSPDGPATQRLHYICSNMKLDDTPIKDWKLPVVSSTAIPVQQ